MLFGGGPARDKAADDGPRHPITSLRYDLQDWEVQIFELKRAEGEPGVQYDWASPAHMKGEKKDTTPYTVDFTTMTQTNEHSGTVRRLVRIPPGPGEHAG